MRNALLHRDQIRQLAEQCGGFMALVCLLAGVDPERAIEETLAACQGVPHSEADGRRIVTLVCRRALKLLGEE